MIKNDELYKKYPWLRITTTVEEYINPQYYNDILKDYIFEEKTDLEHFKKWIENCKLEGKKVLELGCGSGRVTDILLQDSNNFKRLDLLDLSNQMLEFCKQKYINNNKISYINSDTIEYLKRTDEKYDIVYTLWSFSHSVHQIFHEKGLINGKAYIKSAIKKFLKNNLNDKGKFYLIHFDSMSDEQRILLKQWKKVYPTFERNDIQSPSLLLMDETFQELSDENIISYNKRHFVGKEIEYINENEALEVFMNFHMESFFNESDILPQVVNELKDYFKQYTDKNGVIRIKPGCFIYEVSKDE